MANPFDEAAECTVLVNDENQFSLWPQPIPVPAGWRVVYGPGPRQSCLEFVDERWGELRLTGR